MRQLIAYSGFAVILTTALTIAQREAEPKVPTSFEVASVKPNASGVEAGSLRRQPGGGLVATNMPLRMLITYAYQIQPLQLVDLGAIGFERFDITAKMAGEAATLSPGSTDPTALALQQLLADRFRLIAHRETREVDIYALVMVRPGGRPGPALKPSTQDCSPQAILDRRSSASTAAPVGNAAPLCGMQAGSGEIRFGGLPLSQLVGGLSNRVGRLVVDRTGLTGTWDLEVKFAAASPAQSLGPPVDAPSADRDGPSIFTALQEQLGLRLEPAKGPLEVLVIDRLERPIAD